MSRAAKFKFQAVVGALGPLTAAAYIFGLIPHSKNTQYVVGAIQVGAFLWGGLPTLEFAFAPDKAGGE